MSRIKGKLTTADYLPFDEYKKLLKCLREDKLYVYELYCVVGFFLALRVSDILKIKWIDILNKQNIKVEENKTKKVRSIEINEIAQKLIRELYNLLGKPDLFEPIILNPDTGEAFRRNHINHKLKKFKYKYRLSVGSFSTHSFRKAFARHIWNINGRSGESITYLQQILKHSSQDITHGYLGITQEEINKVFRSIKF